MNRYLTQYFYTFLKRPVKLWGKVAIGATGAPTLTAASSMGIASISRTSAGLYVITLADRYSELKQFSWSFTNATASGIYAVEIITDSTTAAAKTLTVTCYNASGTATDPANGATWRFGIELNNTAIAG